MIIGLAQMNIVWEQKEENLKRVESILQRFLEEAEERTKLLVFPEMTLTGFSMNTKATSESEKETVAKFSKLAKKYNTFLAFGWVKAESVEKAAMESDICENHFSIVSPSDGEILDYAKIHPFSYSGEHEFFKGGNHLSFCQVEDFTVSTGVCFDLRFPEIFQKMSDKADLILIPANWPERRRDHWMTLLKARAIENQCYIAGVNCAGMVGDQFYSGDSALYSPAGELLKAKEEILIDASIPEQKLFIYEIENNVKKVRAGFPIKSDRREDLYRTL